MLFHLLSLIYIYVLSRAFDHICMEKARYKLLIIIIIIIIISYSNALYLYWLSIFIVIRFIHEPLARMIEGLNGVVAFTVIG